MASVIYSDPLLQRAAIMNHWRGIMSCDAILIFQLQSSFKLLTNQLMDSSSAEIIYLSLIIPAVTALRAIKVKPSLLAVAPGCS